MSDYIVHKAVELAKVNKKRRGTLAAPGFLEANFIAQPKFDGCNCVFIVEGHSYGVFSRTGEVVKSLDHIKAAMDMLPDVPDGVYLGEAWAHDLEFNEISGRFRKQETNEETARLSLVIFDYLTLAEWEDAHSPLTYEQRTERLPEILFRINQASGAPLCVLRSFGRLHDVWPNATAQDVCNKLVAAGGYDGLILRDPLGTWTKGSNGTNGEIIKVKAKLSFDLEVIGYVPGKGKHDGKIGSLIVRFNGQEMGAGTGLKDSERSVADFEKNWQGKIVEVEAMGYSADGLLREPRLKGIRHDKTVPDA